MVFAMVEIGTMMKKKKKKTAIAVKLLKAMKAKSTFALVVSKLLMLVLMTLLMLPPPSHHLPAQNHPSPCLRPISFALPSLTPRMTCRPPRARDCTV
jgi:hypothetical protein